MLFEDNGWKSCVEAPSSAIQDSDRAWETAESRVEERYRNGISLGVLVIPGTRRLLCFLQWHRLSKTATATK